MRFNLGCIWWACDVHVHDMVGMWCARAWYGEHVTCTRMIRWACDVHMHDLAITAYLWSILLAWQYANPLNNWNKNSCNTEEFIRNSSNTWLNCTTISPKSGREAREWDYVAQLKSTARWMWEVRSLLPAVLSSQLLPSPPPHHHRHLAWNIKEIGGRKAHSQASAKLCTCLTMLRVTGGGG